MSCDECKGWVGALQAYLLTDEDLEVQCQLLTDTLCPEAEDPEGCAAGFHNWWALIGQYYFKYFKVFPIVFFINSPFKFGERLLNSIHYKRKIFCNVKALKLMFKFYFQIFCFSKIKSLMMFELLNV